MLHLFYFCAQNHEPLFVYSNSLHYIILTGSVVEVLCRAGSYCRPQTGEPTPCPAGYYCPQGSYTYNTPQQMYMNLLCLQEIGKLRHLYFGMKYVLCL